MAYSYKGAISFGLIYIPITLNLCIRDNDIHFHMLDKNTMSRIQYKKTCDECENREVESGDIVKGFEYDQDKYVIFTPRDFEKIKNKRDKTITIEQFVNIEEIDPIYYDKSYYVVPTGAEKAFQLLLTAMEEEEKVGIARTVLGYKETLIAIRAKDGQMLLNTLFFYEELQKNPFKQLNIPIQKQELTLAKELIQTLSRPLKMEQFEDEYKNKIETAIEQKIAGKEIVQIEEKQEENISNLMDALQQSLALQEPKSAKKPRKKKTK